MSDLLRLLEKAFEAAYKVDGYDVTVHIVRKEEHETQQESGVFEDV